MSWLVYVIIGSAIGFVVAWFLLERRQAQQLEEMQGHWQQRLEAAQAELGSAIEDNGEIKERILALQLEHQGCDAAIRKAGDRVAEQGARLAEVEIQAQEAREGRSRLQHELDDARNVLAHERVANDRLRAEIEELKTEARIVEESRKTPAAASSITSPIQASLAEIPSPSLALHEAPAAFAADAPGDPIELQQRRQLKAIDAKIAQLPAGSSARQRLEAERASMIAPPKGPARENSKDNLKRIKGIGASLERKLNALGVTRLAQIAAFEPADIARVDAGLDFKGRIEREGWIEQARQLVASSEEATSASS